MDDLYRHFATDLQKDSSQIGELGLKNLTDSEEDMSAFKHLNQDEKLAISDATTLLNEILALSYSYQELIEA